MALYPLDPLQALRKLKGAGCQIAPPRQRIALQSAGPRPMRDMLKPSFFV